MVINQIEYYSQVRARRVEWLWYPYIPYGKLTVIQGDPGEGKSTLILNIAARLSTGKPMPDGSSVERPQTIIYQCAEDSVEDTIKPRLVMAGADCDKVAFIVEDSGWKLCISEGGVVSPDLTTIFYTCRQPYIGQIMSYSVDHKAFRRCIKTLLQSGDFIEVK